MRPMLTVRSTYVHKLVQWSTIQSKQLSFKSLSPIDLTIDHIAYRLHKELPSKWFLTRHVSNYLYIGDHQTTQP